MRKNITKLLACLAVLCCIGTAFALKSMNIDPAIASGPIIATTIDVLGLAIYFGLVSAFLISKVA